MSKKQISWAFLLFFCLTLVLATKLTPTYAKITQTKIQTEYKPLAFDMFQKTPPYLKVTGEVKAPNENLHIPPQIKLALSKDSIVKAQLPVIPEIVIVPVPQPQSPPPPPPVVVSPIKFSEPWKQEIANEIAKYPWGAKAVKVAHCESGLNPSAHNYNPRTGDNSYGIFQINLYGSLARSRPSPTQLVDWKFNIAYAYGMWQRSGFSPWSCAKKLGIK